MRVSVGFDGSTALRDAVSLASAAEASGLDGVWNTEHVGQHDAIVASAAMVMATDSIGVGIVGPSVAARHPGVLAMELCGVAELAGARFRAQVGLGDLGLMSAIGGVTGGADLSPLQAVERFVTVVRSLCAGEVVSAEVLGFVLRDFSLAAPIAFPLDVMAIRPKMIALACSIGDGVSLSVGASRSYLRDSVAAIRATESVHGPKYITAFVYGSVTPSIVGSAAKVARQLAFIDPATFHVLATDAGLPSAADLSEMLLSHGHRAVANHLPVGLVSQCGVVATPETLVAELCDLELTGVDEIVVLPTVRPADRYAFFEVLGQAVEELGSCAPSVDTRGSAAGAIGRGR